MIRRRTRWALLACSCLHPEWGDVEAELFTQRSASGFRNVRIFNLSEPAHTSRDSFLSYGALRNERFEVVVVYDGINDTRANDVPPQLFRDDYSHFIWYEKANRLAPYHRRARLALPLTLDTLVTSIKRVATQDRYVQRFPRPEWTHFGHDVRTLVPFTTNIEGIAELANARRDHLVIMTFATYLSPDDAPEPFEDRRRDHATAKSSIATWGEPQNVLAGVARHNEACGRSPRGIPKTSFVDQAELMPKSARDFDDVCHFTKAGSAKFVRNLVAGWPRASSSNAVDGRSTRQ